MYPWNILTEYPNTARVFFEVRNFASGKILKSRGDICPISPHEIGYQAKFGAKFYLPRGETLSPPWWNFVLGTKFRYYSLSPPQPNIYLYHTVKDLKTFLQSGFGERFIHVLDSWFWWHTPVAPKGLIERIEPPQGMIQMNPRVNDGAGIHTHLPVEPLHVKLPVRRSNMKTIYDLW